ncbi:MAG: response regulator, partial [Bacteroidota bacterium]
MVSGPIVLVDDDDDDQELVGEVLRELNIKNKTVFFDRCEEALVYLKTSDDQPFIIICDVNLPGLSGIEFKRKIDNDPQLRRKSIPFVFYSTSAEKNLVDEVYTQLTVQGYFKKVNS